MAHQIDYELIGDDMQAVIIALDPGEMVQAEAGAMMYMTDGVQMNTGTGGGLLKGVKRILTGESFFITTFQYNGSGQGKVAFAAPYPGKIIPIDLGQMGTMYCQRDAYLCSAYGIDISVAFTKRLGAGFFGGEGFILQKLAGDGLAFVHAGGTIMERDLAAGETLKADTGCLVAFQESVGYDIQFVGGIKTAFFGGEGLFFATLHGPGKVYLQTLPFSRLADRVSAATRANVGEVKRGGSVLGTLGDIIAGDR
ncbi:MAG: TIGR00266 family protein [Calditrichaeota bacterium]|nr:MAG: TIGR00266 family protein [Calditrichota bacterium]